jgi:hypothetical protein
MNTYNTSWGPYWIETGDIIIISAIYYIPLVLRRDKYSYLFVGACWLIDSELRGGESIDDLIEDPGTSSIMRGSA